MKTAKNRLKTLLRGHYNHILGLKRGRSLKADWIVYINLPYQHAYLLPVLPLQMAWQNNKQRWLGYHQKEAKNKGGYTTLSVAIPVQELFKEINNAMIFRYELIAIDKFHMKAIEIGALKNG